MIEIAFLNYEQFGAVGDGVTDDMAAIIACHDAANESGTSVKCKDGARYYIGGGARAATIRTDVDFGTAEFIIDDRSLEDIQSSVFCVVSDFEPYALAIHSLHRDQKNIGQTFSGDTYVKVSSSEKRIFIRKGLNSGSGTDAEECFFVNAAGEIQNRLNWDYAVISHAEAREMDHRPITIKGGIFTTIANQAPSFYHYHHRGVTIQRDYVTVEGLAHRVTGEGDYGAPYRGFLSVLDCVGVQLINCLLTPHRTYQTPSKVPGKMVDMGTYDLNLTFAIRVHMRGLKQTIDIMDKRYWGIMGSNFCKELYLEDCIVSRFDAHQGVTDATIKGCELGHQCLNLIGCGDFLIEDTLTRGGCLIVLRPDYGSTWEGSITVRNCSWIPQSNDGAVIGCYNEGDHDFGYVCYMPHTVTVEGLRILDGAAVAGKENQLFVLGHYDKSFAPGKPFPYVPTQKLVISGLSVESGNEIPIFKESALYPTLSVEYK